MIRRIVKMTFHPEQVDTFLQVFEQRKAAIRAFEGCEHLELLRCTEPDHIFFTYSYWRAPADLEAYRHSDLFKATWAKTKVLFSDKPQAWSTTVASTGQ
jgi:autoinducer 2-degrading protein